IVQTLCDDSSSNVRKECGGKRQLCRRLGTYLRRNQPPQLHPSFRGRRCAEKNAIPSRSFSNPCRKFHMYVRGPAALRGQSPEQELLPSGRRSCRGRPPPSSSREFYLHAAAGFVVQSPSL